MKKNKLLGLIIVLIASVFLIIYIAHGIHEKVYPYKFLGFPYKSVSFYFLKLAYAVMFLLSGVALLKPNKWTWYLAMFSSIGMLMNSMFYLFYGYVFRTTPIDLFLLEILSFFVVILYNIKAFTTAYGIILPHKKVWHILLFVSINILLNYAAWMFVV